jgi:hypothetical protein
MVRLLFDQRFSRATRYPHSGVSTVGTFIAHSPRSKRGTISFCAEIFAANKKITVAAMVARIINMPAGSFAVTEQAAVLF